MGVGVGIVFLLAISAGVCDEFDDRASEILDEVPLIDGHNDLAWNLMIHTDGALDGIDLEQDTCDQFGPEIVECHTDIPRLVKGQVGAVFWSIFTRCSNQYKNGVAQATELIDMMRRVIRKYDYAFSLATSADDVEAAFAEGRVASLLGLEGGHMIGESLAVLRSFYELGVRYLTLTWNCNTGWADNSNPDGDELTPAVGGLSDWGKQLVVEMGRLGMLVDLSHVSPQAMMDALDVAIAPVIFSHSSAYAICPHRRNVPDDVLLRVRDNGGVVMLNFYTKFLNCTEDNRYELGFRSASLDQLMDHMDHIRGLIGADHVGLGSDFDGIPYVIEDLADVSMFPNLVAGLLRRGWEEDDVKKVVGENLLRVFRAAEQVRDASASLPPNDTPFPEDLPDDSCQPKFDSFGSRSSSDERDEI